MTGNDLKNERLKRGLNQTEFAQLIGYERSVVSKMEAKEGDISDTIAAKIILRLKHDNAHSGTELRDQEVNYRIGKAGHSVARNHRAHVRGLLAPVVEDMPEAIYELFQVEGSSMETTLTQGDFLLCRLESIDQIADGRVYVLVLKDPILKEYRESGIWIKRCAHRKANGYISCRSDNKDTSEPYPVFRVKTSDVQECWYPVMKITHHLADPNRDVYDRLDELEGRIEMLEDLNQ